MSIPWINNSFVTHSDTYVDKLCRYHHSNLQSPYTFHHNNKYLHWTPQYNQTLHSMYHNQQHYRKRMEPDTWYRYHHNNHHEDDRQNHRNKLEDSRHRSHRYNIYHNQQLYMFLWWGGSHIIPMVES